jgi:hypothetical protein
MLCICREIVVGGTGGCARACHAPFLVIYAVCFSVSLGQSFQYSILLPSYTLQPPASLLQHKLSPQWSIISLVVVFIIGRVDWVGCIKSKQTSGLSAPAAAPAVKVAEELHRAARRRKLQSWDCSRWEVVKSWDRESPGQWKCSRESPRVQK